MVGAAAAREVVGRTRQNDATQVGQEADAEDEAALLSVDRRGAIRPVRCGPLPVSLPQHRRH